MHTDSVKIKLSARVQIESAGRTTLTPLVRSICQEYTETFVLHFVLHCTFMHPEAPVKKIQTDSKHLTAFPGQFLPHYCDLSRYLAVALS